MLHTIVYHNTDIMKNGRFRSFLFRSFFFLHRSEIISKIYRKFFANDNNNV